MTMDFTPTFEQQAIRDTARRFAEEVVQPQAAEIDTNDRFFFDLLAAAGRLGLIAVDLAEVEGGAGADPLATILSVEEIGRRSPVVASTLGALRTHIMLLSRFGTKAQKERYLPRLIAGTGIAALAVTEPDAGSDLAGTRTRARRDGAGYRLDGAKCFTSFGNICDFYFVLAYTDPDQGTRHGMTLFLVDRDTPGITVGPEEAKLGQRGVPLTAETFEDVSVPADCVLGREGEGFGALMQCFDATRTEVAAQGLGISLACFEAAARYAGGRVQFGRPIIDHQAIQWMLVDMETEIEAGRLLTYKAATLLARGVRCSREASRAKLFCSDKAMRHATDAIQIFGGYGYLKSNPVERLFRDAKVLQIYDGTNQIQRLILAREIRKEVIAR